MQNGSVFEWSDLRFFLAVMRAGNTLAASRMLRVSQTTVARRIVALEAALGVELFDKRRTGYAPTDNAWELVETATIAEAALHDFEAKAQGQKRALTGTVRLTTNELFANQLIAGMLRDFRAAYPGIRLEIITSDRSLDLARGEADVALRGTLQPTQADLFGRRLAKDRWSVYCSREYEARHGKPANMDEMVNHAVIGLERGLIGGSVARWLENEVPEEAVVVRRNSVAGLFAGTKSGLGVSLMSDVIAASDADFVYCFTPDMPNPYEIWLLTHERLRDAPRIRAVMKFIAGRFEAIRIPAQL